MSLHNTRLNLNVEALSRDANDAALAVAWLNVDFEFGECVFLDVQSALKLLRFSSSTRLTDRIKSLHQPLSLFPATLHPADATA